jgi:hypothetical protein
MRLIYAIEPSSRRAGRRVGRRIAFSLAGLVLATGFLAACDTNRLLDVTTPNAVPVSTLDEPSNAALMINSMVGDYQCALGSAVVVEALIAGEMNDAQLGAAQWDYARRSANALTNGIYGTAGCAATQAPGIYLPLSTARFDVLGDVDVPGGVRQRTSSEPKGDVCPCREAVHGRHRQRSNGRRR